MACRPSVGSSVAVKSSGRVGQITVDSGGSELCYKVVFDDGAIPESDWFNDLDVHASGSATLPATNLLQSNPSALAQDCSICLAAFENACLAPCNHIYCRTCIQESFKMQPPEWSGACPLCRRPISLYELQDISSGSMLATCAVKTIYGNVFVQHGGVGVASYHFIDEDNCYISYANAPADWKLDNGEPAPAQKPFTQRSWDPETRTFRGTVEWDPKFNGSSKWEYEIVFAPDYFGVVGGSVLVNDGPQKITFHPPWENPTSGLNYLRWTPPPESVFGGVYVQGHFYHTELEGVASYHFNSETDCYISYANAPSQWGTLDGGTPLPTQKQFSNCSYDAVARTFAASVEWNPMFHGRARWDYYMVFAEDFSRITSGTFQAFGIDGVLMEEKDFVDPIRASRAGGMRYVRKPGALMQPAPC